MGKGRRRADEQPDNEDHADRRPVRPTTTGEETRGTAHRRLESSGAEERPWAAPRQPRGRPSQIHRNPERDRRALEGSYIDVFERLTQARPERRSRDPSGGYGPDAGAPARAHLEIEVDPAKDALRERPSIFRSDAAGDRGRPAPQGPRKVDVEVGPLPKTGEEAVQKAWTLELRKAGARHLSDIPGARDRSQVVRDPDRSAARGEIEDHDAMRAEHGRNLSSVRSSIGGARSGIGILGRANLETPQRQHPHDLLLEPSEGPLERGWAACRDRETKQKEHRGAHGPKTA